MVKHLVTKVVVVISVGLLASGCVPRPEIAPYSNLINQGLLPVSTTNPYLGANLFLSGEAQRSGYLLNFLKQRGGPVAIELETSNFGVTSLLLYYPKDREVYRAELQILERGNVEVSEWLVRGPYAIERRDYRELGRLDGSLVGEPIFLIRGKQVRFGQQVPATNEQSLATAGNLTTQGHQETVIVPAVPTPKPKKRAIVSKSAAQEKASKDPAGPSVAQTPDAPLNSDQQALRLAQGLVERNASGDAVHIVVSDKQDLKKLAEWYTGDAANAKALAAASGLEGGKEPPLASRVVIPKGLIKNEKRLID